VMAFVLAFLLLASAAAEDAETPAIEVPATVDGAAFFEPFLDTWDATWKISKDADFKGTWKHEGYSTEVIVGDKGLVVGDMAQKHAVSTLFATPFKAESSGLVIQYEVQLKNGLSCGGAYLKLLTASEELSHDGFQADTPYTLMFGPDSCGDTKKVHFIMRHKNPISGEWEEKHLVTPPVPDVIDKKTHLYTAIVGTDNSVKILVDNEEKKSANLLTKADFSPAINPPEEVDDPEDKKPDDWVENPKMDEPGAAKPDEWDEDAPREIADPKSSKPADWLDDAPELVPDPAAITPDDWDAEEDGEWEAPLIANPDCKAHGCGEWKAPLVPNPDYKGKWFAPKVDNPDYKGVWSPRQIPNPNFFTDEKPYAMAPIGGIGIELWTMQNGILFDNILLTDDPAVASALAAKSFVPRKAGEDAAKKDESRKVEKGEGLLGSIKYYGLQAFYYAQDNAMLVGGSICIGLIPLILLCCMGGKKKQEEDEEPTVPPAASASSAAPAAAASASTPAEEEEEEEAEEEDEAEGDEEPAPAAESKKPKKRTPKAS